LLTKGFNKTTLDCPGGTRRPGRLSRLDYERSRSRGTESMTNADGRTRPRDAGERQEKES